MSIGDTMSKLKNVVDERLKLRKTEKEKMAERRALMTKEQLAYVKRKDAIEKIWPFFRFLILFGLCFVILYPLIFMISCAFREQVDMNDPL